MAKPTSENKSRQRRRGDKPAVNAPDAVLAADPKAAESHPLDSETMFRAVLESAPDAILLIDERGTIVLVNTQTEAMFGYSRQQLVGKSVEMFLPLEFRDLWRPSATGTPKARSIGSELGARRSDGSTIPVEVSFSPLTLTERPLAISIIRDVSERMKAAAQLKQQAMQEAAIAQFGRTAVVQYDLDRLMEQAVQTIAQTLNVPFAGILELCEDGAALAFKSRYIAPSAPRGFRQQVETASPHHLGSFAGFAVRTGQPVVYGGGDEARFDVSPPRAIGIEAAAAATVRLQDRPYGCLTACALEPRAFTTEDLHFLEAVAYLLSVAIERKLAEETVRRDRDFAESLIETAQAIVLVLDPQGRIVRFNAFTEELTGHRLADLKGSLWRTALLPESNFAEGWRMFEAAAAGKRFASATQAVITKTGDEHEIEWSGRALTDENGAVTGVLLIGHDISELRAAQKKLLESERLAAIGQMASGLAHESRNALQQIGACAEMLHMELEDQPKALDLVSGVQDAEERLHRLFEDVRVYAVPLRLTRRSVNLAASWRKAWQQVMARNPGREIALVEDCEGLELEMSVDPSFMEQAFANVLQNCFDATPDPGRITVKCRETTWHHKAAVRVSLRDNGPGFSAEQYESVLLPFYTTKTQGTGLGLPIVARIVDAHGGLLEVGLAATPGAEVIFTLPRE